MKKINFIGMAELKTEYILYICKMLKEMKKCKVLLITDNVFFQGESKPYEYSSDIDLFVLSSEDDTKGIVNQFEYASYDYIIHDSQDSLGDIEYFNKVVVSDTFSHHINYAASANEEIDHLLIMNLLSNSKITPRFIQKKFNVKVENIIHFYLELKDRAILIDNSYNNSLRVKNFSKVFKESLTSLLMVILQEENEEIVFKEIKKVWRNSK